VRRASEAEQLADLAVFAPTSEKTGELRAAIPANVPIFTSGAPDAFGRMWDCLNQYLDQIGAAVLEPTTKTTTDPHGRSPQGVVRLRADCPLLDPCLVDRLVVSVAADSTVDYATFRSPGTRSVWHAQLGLCGEYFRTDAFRALARLNLSPAERQDFGTFMCSHPDRFRLRLLALPPGLDREDLRLSVRHPDDLEHAEQIVEALGTDKLDWQRIVELLDRQPVLRQRMAALNAHEPH
jgi:spore coat polysaccharide biosynthesis protein SpsF (cytidylyltransferase family)